MILTLGVASGVTLTADATESVVVPAAAGGTLCLVVPATEECTDKRGEVIFGNAVVRNFNGDETGLVLIQFGGQLYRASSGSLVYEYQVITTDGDTRTATSRTISQIENIENYEATRLLGLQGTLSQILPSGEEIYTTGEVRAYEDEKGKIEEPVPVGEYYVEYAGLVLQNADECGEYNYLDEQGQPVKGISARECVSQRGVMTAGEYTDLELIINAPGGVSSTYTLTEITSTTSFEWAPEVPG